MNENFVRCISGTGGNFMYYDPIQDSPVNNEKPLNPEEIKNLMSFQELLFNELFSDVQPGSIVSGPTEHLGLTIEQIKSFNFGFYSRHLFGRIHDMISSHGFTPNVKLNAKLMILDQVNKIMSSTNSYNQFSAALTGTFAVSNRDRKNRELREVVKNYDQLTRRYGKIAIVDYEVSFTYRSKDHKEENDVEKLPVFVDSEGLCLTIYPIKDSDKSTLSEGIFVQKVTTESPPNKPFITLPLPTEGICTKSELLNGIFFSSLNEFKEVYRREFKSNYDSSTDDIRSFNIKKMVGRYLFNGVTETSHGLVSIIYGFSLTRDKFYTCSPDSGVSEILNITPQNLSDIEFTNALNEVGLTRDLLQQHDYILRKTNIGPGSGKSPSQNVRFDKIKLNKSTGLSNITNALMDMDLSLFNETGIAVFTTKEAAERCLRHGGGDVENYIQYIMEKTYKKSDKNAFMESLKSAALVGAGAALPKLVEHFIKKNKERKGEELLMSIMKPMHPPLTTGLSIGLSLTPFKIPALIMKGVHTMGIVSSIGSFFTNIFSKDSDSSFIERLKEVASNIFEFVKKIGVSCWEIVKTIASKIKGGFEILFNSEYSFSERLQIIFGAIKQNIISIYEWSKDKLFAIIDYIKPLVGKVWEFVTNAASTVWGWINGFFGAIFA